MSKNELSERQKIIDARAKVCNDIESLAWRIYLQADQSCKEVLEALHRSAEFGTLRRWEVNLITDAIKTVFDLNSAIFQVMRQYGKSPEMRNLHRFWADYGMTDIGHSYAEMLGQKSGNSDSQDDLPF